MARPQQDSKVRMDEILDAAESLFSISGYKKTTVREIAANMGVAQGMFYYYFKSKEEILEALINRQIANQLTDIKSLLSSPDILPPQKIEIMLNAVFQIVQYDKGLFLDVLSDEKNLHLKNRVFRQATLLLEPWLLKIVNEGVQKQFFHTIHVNTTIKFIISILLCLGEAFCEKLSDELMHYHIKIATALLEQALGMTEKDLTLTLYSR